MSPTLRKPRIPTDATGEPIAPDRLYTPISPHARGHRVFNPDASQLSGDHEAVLACPALWVAVDASTPVKNRAVLEHRRAAQASIPPEPPPPAPPEIDPAHRVVALESIRIGDGRIIERGAILSDDDPAVRRSPQWFERRSVVAFDDGPAPA